MVGGWAVEAFTGIPRHHQDIDVAVCRHDLAALCVHLSRRFHLWSNQEGSLRFLESDGCLSRVPGNFVQTGCARTRSPWLADLLVHPGEPGTWIKGLPSMVLPLEQATWVGPDGLRYQPAVE